jgi:hypothetical protein
MVMESIADSSFYSTCAFQLRSLMRQRQRKRERRRKRERVKGLEAIPVDHVQITSY